jgi:GTP-binding protein Era
MSIDGFVSILGRPNAGKSTLLNALLGNQAGRSSRPRPQTTRTGHPGRAEAAGRADGVRGHAWIHESSTLLNKRMMDQVRASA